MTNNTIQTTRTFTGPQIPIHSWGDQLTQKENDSFRIYFQNIKSIRPQYIDRWQHIVKTTLADYNCDIVGLCETGLNWKRDYTRNKIKNSIKY